MIGDEQTATRLVDGETSDPPEAAGELAHLTATIDRQHVSAGVSGEHRAVGEGGEQIEAIDAGSEVDERGWIAEGDADHPLAELIAGHQRAVDHRKTDGLL